MRFLFAVYAVGLCACGGSSATNEFDAAQLIIDGGSFVDAGNDPAQLCVDTINMYRATLGLKPYTRWTSNETCVSGQAKSDFMANTAHSAFGQCGENAQNECPGWPGPPSSIDTNCLAQMWAEGPGSDFSTHGHYINMTSMTYTQVACGFYESSTTGTGTGSTWWAAQDFK